MESPAVQTIDRLSALPDELLRRILIAANLDLKSIAQTSILSRRWRTVWKSSLHNDIYKPWGANFSALRTLRLYRCILRLALRTIPNLSSLEVIECEFSSDYPFKISGDKLVHLALVNFKVNRINIVAPQLESFTCKDTIKGVSVHPLQILGLDVPSLECLNIDICLEDSKEANLKIFGFMKRFNLVKRVKLHPGIIKALTMVPGLLEREDSPFKNVQFLEFHDSGGLISSRRVFNALVSYFFDDFIRGSALFERVVARLGTLYFYLLFAFCCCVSLGLLFHCCFLLSFVGHSHGLDA
ncbi:hypothetical protein LINPERHAP2_LOCUS37843 [Linum perenne]